MKMERQATSVEARRRMLELTFGSCSDDPSLEGIFELIDRERHAEPSREIDKVWVPSSSTDAK